MSQELGNLVSKLETKNSVTFLEFREGLNREVKEEFFLGVYLSVSFSPLKH